MDSDRTTVITDAAVIGLAETVFDYDGLPDGAKAALHKLEIALTMTIALDSDIAIAEQNKLFDRAGEAYDKAVRAQANGGHVRSKQNLMIAKLVAEEALAALGKNLRAEARQRFATVEKYLVDHAAYLIDDWAKLKLESARYLLRFAEPTEIWMHALNSLQALRFLIEAKAIAYHNIKTGEVRVHNEAPTATTATTDTLRWSAA